MNVNDIATLISSVGFPIVACVGLFYLYDKTIKELTSTLRGIDDTLKSIDERLKGIEEGTGVDDDNA